MKVVFLGVGEAFDEEIPNNSHLISSDTNLLLDCGYSVPRQLWKYTSDQSFLDAIYISHKHADHYFGIPALLVRMWEERRNKPLTIICQRSLESSIKELIEYGYEGFSKKFEFDINFIKVKKGKTIKFNEFELSFASTTHSTNNLAIKIFDGKNAVCYSGDGMFNEETEKLYENADLVIHEAYFLRKNENIITHASIDELIRMAERNNVKCLALTHIQRDLRKEIKEKFSQEMVKIIIPNPFEEYSF
ncbi:MAG: MBL fold metallo-hydrolase [Candidatus Hydrothermarchaeota archaeon]